MTENSYDLLTLGRVSMDLFSLNIGAPFEEIEAFDTSIGGSPTNIALAASRLGLNVAALTAVGEDKVGDFVLNYLQKEGVDTQHIPRKPDTRTGLAVLGIQPPDQFPLVFYRDNVADVHLTIDDILAAPLADSRALLLSGTALSRGTCRDATLFAAELGHAAATTVFMDLDLRPDQWSHPRTFGLNMRSILPNIDVIIGTEEEFYAALSPDPAPVMHGETITAEGRAELQTHLDNLLKQANESKVLVVKRSARGASVYFQDNDAIDVAGFPVEVLNTVGAGDAFASGLIYGNLQGWDWHKSVRMANACGALVVTRHGCAKAMPYKDEIMEFVAVRGGF